MLFEHLNQFTRFWHGNSCEQKRSSKTIEESKDGIFLFKFYTRIKYYMRRDKQIFIEYLNQSAKWSWMTEIEENI